MQLVETIEVGAGGAASIEFTSIPQDADDLLLVVSGRTDSGDGGATNVRLNLRPNGDTANMTYRLLYGTGSGTGSLNGTGIGGQVNGSGSTASTFSSVQFYFTNYSGSSNKSVSVDSVVENNATASDQRIVAGLWSQTTAITSVQVVPQSGNLVQYSSASLYKIVKAA